MNKNLRKAMISAICMLIVGVMSLTGVTYAWFTASNSAVVEGMTIDVFSADGGVMISMTNSNDFAYRVTWEKNVAGFKPASTGTSTLDNGALKFYTATVDMANDPMGSGKSITSSVAEENTHYIKQTFYLYNPQNKDLTVSLANSSIIAREGTGMKDNGAEKAARIAVVQHDTYAFGGSTPADGKGGVTIVEPYFAQHVSSNAPEGKITYYGLITDSTGTFDATQESDKVESITPAALDEVAISVPSGQCRAVTVYIWLEGQDIDCTNIVSGSNLKAELQFTAAGVSAE